MRARQGVCHSGSFLYQPSAFGPQPVDALEVLRLFWVMDNDIIHKTGYYNHTRSKVPLGCVWCSEEKKYMRVKELKGPLVVLICVI